jgi:hypothetical protein
MIAYVTLGLHTFLSEKQGGAFYQKFHFVVSIFIWVHALFNFLQLVKL